MKTRVISIGETKKEKTFPKLMKADTRNDIVFFKRPEYGMCILSDDISHVGNISKVWDMECFEDMPETHVAFNVEVV